MKKTIVLLHGLRGTHHGLSAIADALTERGYETITPDLPGSGEEKDIANKNLDAYAEWLHKMITKLPHKPYIVGHSMGSIVASHYLEKYPDDVQRKVVFISPIFRTKTGQLTSNILYALSSGALHLVPRKPRYNFMRSKAVSFCISHYLTADKSQQKQIDELHYKYSGRFVSADSLLKDMKISMREQTVFPANKDALYIMGNKDRLTKVKLARKRVAEKGADFTELDATGHLINYEKPEQVADAIAEFLA